MAKGWKISTVRPGRGASGALRQELFLVAISDKVEAVRAVQECLPDAEVKIESEASSLRNIRSTTAKCRFSQRARDAPSATVRQN